MIKKNGRSIVLYIGGSKLIALRARSDAEGNVFVESWQKRDPTGFTGSAVSDVELARSQAQEILTAVSGDAPLDSMPFYVVISDLRVSHYKASSSLYFGRTKVIDDEDVREVVQQTKSIATLPLDEVIISTFPQEYIVSDLSGISNPLGLEGKRLGVSLHLFTLPVTVHRALIDLWDQMEIGPDSVYPGALASMVGVTDQKERNEGVVGIDLGAKMVEINYFFRGVLRDSKRIQRGGDDLTDFISKKWNMGFREAERLKEEYATADASTNFPKDMIPVMDERGQVKCRIPGEEFAREISLKIRESLQEIEKEIALMQKEHVHLHQAVITGGPARVHGLVELFQSVLKIPCRIGLVKGVQGAWELVGSPAHTSVVGVLKVPGEDTASGERREGRNILERSFDAVKGWIQDYF